ncbi:MAG: molecular chaperone HtpG, partial [Eubacterium sp.]|nr:molecular chaperone HtpG [Eubacterium sp.]
LQNDGFVKKISEYITKKVADKLTGMCKTEKESYEKYWDDISPFIKYGCLRDDKFCDKMNDYILFKNLDHKYLTLPECLKADEEETAAQTDNENTDNADNTNDTVEVENADGTSATGSDAEEPEEEKDTRKVIYYVTDEQQQSQYINMFREQNMDAVILDHNIDSSFITQLERRNEKFKFMRIDADVTESLKEESSAEELKEETDTLTEIFRKAIGNDKLTVKVEKLKNETVSSIITLSEEGRRMQEMMKMYAMGGMGGMDTSMFGGDATLTLNANNTLVKYIFENKDSEHVPTFCQQLYDLAMISNQPLAPDAMTRFIARSNEIMMLLAK